MAITYLKRILQMVILGFGLFYLFSLLWLFSKRLVYPYELDWIEGGMLTSVIHILDGNNLYTAPSIHYVPFVYAPIFFYFSAIVAKILGASLLTLRLVSAVASLVSLGTIVLIVWGETKSWFWGLASAGLFAGLYPATRFWFDLARVDSVFLMFFLLFLWSIRRGSSLRWQVLAGIFLTLTILTKQNGMTMCLPILAVYCLFEWRKRMVLPGIFVLLYTILTLIFVFSSNGWYVYYCFTLAFSKPNDWQVYPFLDFIHNFLASNIPIALVLSLSLFPLWFSRAAQERFILWLVALVGTIATSYLAKANLGGVNNVVMPTFAILSILCGIAAHELVLRLHNSRYHALAEIGICLLIVLQLGQLAYNPFSNLPSSDAYKNGVKALKWIKKFDGNVYLPNSPIALMAGKETFAHPSAVWDVFSSERDSLAKDILADELNHAVESKLFDAIVVLPAYNYFPGIEKNYEIDKTPYILVDTVWYEKASVYILKKP